MLRPLPATNTKTSVANQDYDLTGYGRGVALCINNRAVVVVAVIELKLAVGQTYAYSALSVAR